MINDRKIAERASQLEAERTPYAVATVVRCKAPTAAKPGYKALITAAGDIHGWIGGGCAQPAVIKTARQVLRDGLPQLIRVSPNEGAHSEDDLVDFKSACYSGGSLDIFIEPVLSQPDLLLFGSSEVAQSLATLAHFAGFVVTVLSPVADELDFPWADQVIKSFDLCEARFSCAPLVVVATQGKGDQAALGAALGIDTLHRSFIASARKADKLKQLLKGKGHDPEAVDQILAPAGVDIGAKAPAEIAVSVLAALIAARHAVPDAVVQSEVQDSGLTPVSRADISAEPADSEAVTPAARASCCGDNPAL
ncbi:MAG: XdhC family protein [Gammaproteobacteria bacterium]|nr:XdhC family protein [Gammaproteobacteria bacterium]